MSNIIERKRIASPTVTPQALAWDGANLWMSSRDLGTLYKVDIDTWKIVDEIDPPGIVWAGVSLGDGEMRFTIGKGLNDDRYVYRYAPDDGFMKLFALLGLHRLVPEFRRRASLFQSMVQRRCASGRRFWKNSAHDQRGRGNLRTHVC
jgi:hypothetical protein